MLGEWYAGVDLTAYHEAAQPMDMIAERPARARRASDFTGAQIAVLAFVLLLLASLPIWTHPVPPLSDYANHLARMHVIANLGENATLAGYYEVHWQIIPNLMMDLVVPVLGRVTNIYLAGQLFTAATFALIVSGALALNRALFGRWSALPLMCIPLLYNHVFLVGVMNYVFGIGFALWALAASIALRERPWPLRFAVSTACVVALFFCHLFAVGLYGIGVLAWELWRAWCRREEPLGPRLLEFAASGLPFLAVLPLLLSSPTLQLAGVTEWEPRGKIDGLRYVIETYSDILALLLAGIVAAAASWAHRRKLLRVHPFAWVLLAVGALVYLAMPRVLFASYLADQRLPIALAFAFFAGIDVKLHHRLVGRGFIAILLTLVAVRLIEVDVSWSRLGDTTAQFRSSVKRVKPGAKVLVAYGARLNNDVSDLGLVHAACLAMIERSALVSTAFTVTGKHILGVRPEFRDRVDTLDGTPPSIGELMLAADQAPAKEPDAYWRLWPTRFDYLYVLFTDPDDPNPDPRHLDLVQSGDRFQLYRIRAET